MNWQAIGLKNAPFYKGMSAYWVFLIYEGAISFLLSMIFTASMIYQVTMVGLSPLQLVLVGTTLEAAVFLFEIPTGVVADMYSRRLSVIIGVVLIGVGFIIEGTCPLFIPILIAQVIWGLGITFTSGATQAWISDEIGEGLAGRAFLRAKSAWKSNCSAGDYNRHGDWEPGNQSADPDGRRGYAGGRYVPLVEDA